MGNFTSLLNEAHKKEFSNGFDDLNQLGGKSHPYFGRILIFRKIHSKDFLFSKVFQQSQQLITQNMREDTLRQQHRERCKIQHKNILKYYGSTYNYMAMQGDLSETKLYFEFQQLNLQEILNFHSESLALIEEIEIWRIAQQVIEACTYLEEKNMSHGDLNLQSIFIDRSRTVKILYCSAYGGLLSTFSKSIEYGDTKGFLSPQAMQDSANCRRSKKMRKSISLTKYPNSFDPYKQDSFSFGMTLLELMSQKKSSDCYDYNQNVINQRLIMERLGQSRENYSYQLIQLVQRLLIFDEQARPTLSQLLNYPDLSKNSTVKPKNQPPPRITQYNSPHTPKQTIRYLSPQIASRSPQTLIRQNSQVQSRFTLPTSLPYLTPKNNKVSTTNSLFYSPQVKQQSFVQFPISPQVQQQSFVQPSISPATPNHQPNSQRPSCNKIVPSQFASNNPGFTPNTTFQKK